MRGGLTGWGTDEKGLFASLEGKTPEQIAALKLNYQQHFGRDMVADIRSELSGADLAKANTLLAGTAPSTSTSTPATSTPPATTPAEDAAKLQKALGGFFGPNKTEVQSLLDGRTPAELQALNNAYHAQTGQSLDAALASRMKGEDLAFTQSLATGGVSDAQRLHYAMQGWGTNEDAIKSALAGKSPAEIAQIERDYQQQYGGNLRQELGNELSGRDAFQVNQMLEGAPQTLDQAISNLEEQRAFERNGSSGFIDFVNRTFKGEADGQRLDTQVAAARTAYDQAAADGVITEAEQQRVAQQMRFAGQDVQTYQQTKDSAAEAAATAGVAVVTTAAVVATGGAATPVAIAAYAALGAGTRAGIQAAIQGDALGREGLLREAALGAIEGGTVMLPGAGGAGHTGLQAAQATAREQVLNAAMAGVREGAVSGALTGGVEQALQDETWRNGLLPGMANVATSSLQGGVIGGVTGGLSSAAVTSGSLAFNAAAEKAGNAPGLLPSAATAVPEAPPPQVVQLGLDGSQVPVQPPEVPRSYPTKIDSHGVQLPGYVQVPEDVTVNFTAFPGSKAATPPNTPMGPFYPVDVARGGEYVHDMRFSLGDWSSATPRADLPRTLGDLLATAKPGDVLKVDACRALHGVDARVSHALDGVIRYTSPTVNATQNPLFNLAPYTIKP